MPEDENLSLLNKRISDLESTFSEMKERFEEIQDLVMIEQVGITEIKNMIEEVKSTSPEASSLLPNFESRLVKIENEIEQRMRKINEKSEGPLPVAEVERIYGKIDELEGRITQPKIVTTDDELVPFVDSLKKEMELLNSRTDDIEKKMERMKLEKPMTGHNGELEEEIEKLRILENNAREIFNSISTLSKEITNDKNEVMRKTTEISGLVNKIGSSGSSPSLYPEIKALKERTETLETEYYSLSKQMKFLKPEEFERAMEKIGGMAVSIEDKYREELNDLKETINKAIMNLKTSNDSDKVINDLTEKIVFLESRLKVVEKNIDDAIGSKPVVLE